MRATIVRKVAIIQVVLVHKDNQVEEDNKKGDTKLEMYYAVTKLNV